MRVFICSDMEGVTGIVKRRQTDAYDTPDYLRACELFTAEVVAAVEGAHAAGADEVVVADSHGPASNLDPRDFPDYAGLVQGWPRPLNMMEGIQDESYDAAVLIGHHTAITSVDGNFPHTVSSGTYTAVRINGVEVSEAQLNTWIAGHYGIPVVAATGDDAFVKHIKEFIPSAETFTTKRSCGMYAANQLSHHRVLKGIKKTVQDGVERAADVSPIKIDGPIKLDLEFKERFLAHVLSYLPGFETENAHTLRAQCSNITEAIRIIGAVPHLNAELF